VRAWWGDLHKNLTNIGIAGIWNDMNEPAIDERPSVILVENLVSPRRASRFN
jgi:alpha-glucosidase (family GH31 glycosyl hydrolase)